MKIFRHPPEDIARKLLDECNLPSSDLDSAHLASFFGCGSPEELEGIIGLEVFGPVALLRSLAVVKSARGKGCAKALVSAVEKHAQENGIDEMYLLTNTAEQFFMDLEYTHADREKAPEKIKQTKEFSALCPENASFMLKKLIANQ